MALKISDEIINYIRSKINNLNYPIGYIFITTTNTNPNKILGVGTWVSFGKGKTLVGIDTSQTEFNTIEKTGGSKTHTLTERELPVLKGDGQFKPYDGFSTSGIVRGKVWNEKKNFSQSPGATEYTNIYGMEILFGGGQSHNNLQPYITVYMWKRTK